MKKVLTKVISVGALGIISIIPMFSYGQQDCNRFGGSCYVDGVNTLRTNEEPKPTLLTTIRRAINFVLTLLATVATLICMYAGFKMLTSGGDSKGYDAGFKMLKNALIGLGIIALSWIIVSAVLWFIDTAAEGNSLVGDSDTQDIEIQS